MHIYLMPLFIIIHTLYAASFEEENVKKKKEKKNLKRFCHKFHTLLVREQLFIATM
jgi:hypothetical protein